MYEIKFDDEDISFSTANYEEDICIENDKQLGNVDNISEFIGTNLLDAKTKDMIRQALKESKLREDPKERMKILRKTNQMKRAKKPSKKEIKEPSPSVRRKRKGKR
jgi:hypothetical protein